MRLFIAIQFEESFTNAVGVWKKWDDIYRDSERGRMIELW